MVMLVLLELLTLHQLQSTRLPKRCWIPWPIFTWGWNHRTLSSIRSKVSFHILSRGSTLKVSWAPLIIRLLLMLSYIYLCIYWSGLFYHFICLVSKINLYIWCWCFIFFFCLLCVFQFIFYILCHFLKKREIIDNIWFT